MQGIVIAYENLIAAALFSACAVSARTSQTNRHSYLISASGRRLLKRQYPIDLPNRVNGATVYADWDFHHHLGIEGEFRYVKDGKTNIYEKTYEIGPRYS